MERKAIGIGSYLLMTTLFFYSGLRLGQNWADAAGYAWFVLGIIPLAAFAWGVLMGILAVKPVWLWPLAAGLWEVLFMLAVFKSHLGIEWTMVVSHCLLVALAAGLGTMLGCFAHKFVGRGRASADSAANNGVKAIGRKAASAVLFSICSIIVLGCGFWVRQLGGEANFAYAFWFSLRCIPIATFGWGLLMGCLAVRHLWRWPLLTELWEVVFIVIIVNSLNFDLVQVLVIFYLLAFGIAVVGMTVDYGLYKLVHLKDEAA